MVLILSQGIIFVFGKVTGYLAFTIQFRRRKLLHGVPPVCFLPELYHKTAFFSTIFFQFLGIITSVYNFSSSLYSIVFGFVFRIAGVILCPDMSHSNCSWVISMTSCFVRGHWYLPSRSRL